MKHNGPVIGCRGLWLYALCFVTSAGWAAGVDVEGPSPWPEIRKERIAVLLPQAMQAAEIDAWLILCRENSNDPLAEHVGGENAGGYGSILVLPGR